MQLSRRSLFSLGAASVIALALPVAAVSSPVEIVPELPVQDKYDILIEGHDAVIASAMNREIVHKGEAFDKHMEIMKKHLSFVNEHFHVQDSDEEKINQLIRNRSIREYSKENLMGMTDGMVAAFSFGSLIWNSVPHVCRTDEFDAFANSVVFIRPDRKKVA